MKDRIRYSEAFKLKVMEELRDAKWKSAKEAATAYGIAEMSVYNWMRKLGFEHLKGRLIYVKTRTELDRIKELEEQVLRLKQSLADEVLDHKIDVEFLKIACKRAGTTVDDLKKKEWWGVAHWLHEEEKVPVKRVCSRCGRSTVVYYKDRKARARLANKEDFILLLARRERIVNPMAGCEKVLYAIRPAMAEEDVTMGVNRFYRLMKKNGMMVPKRKKYSCTTTKQDKSLVPSPNLVKTMKITAPDQALCSDITYIYTEEGFLFLSLMMDMFAHDIVGWAVSNSLKTEGPLAALAMASRALGPDAKPVAHSDRGCQYNSHAYIKALEKLGWKSSMTEELHCYENAMAERLNGILKYEYFLNTHFKTKAEAMKAIEEAIRVYNTRRLHESLGFKTPKAFREEAMRKAA